MSLQRKNSSHFVFAECCSADVLSGTWYCVLPNFAMFSSVRTVENEKILWNKLSGKALLPLRAESNIFVISQNFIKTMIKYF